MELDDLKNVWQNYLNEEKVDINNLLEPKHTHAMNVSDVLSKLSKTTIYRWKFTKNVIIILFSLLVMNISFFVLFPGKFQNLENALPVFGTVALFGLVMLLAYYEQMKIFDISDAVNIKAGLKSTIYRFNRWYILSTLVYVLIFPVIFYAVVNMGFEIFHVALPFLTEVTISGILSVIALVVNHLYYKRTYFRWLHTLNKNLDELREN